MCSGLFSGTESVRRDVGAGPNAKLSYRGHIQSRDAPPSCPPGLVHGLYLLQNPLSCEEWTSASFLILFFGTCLLSGHPQPSN